VTSITILMNSIWPPSAILDLLGKFWPCHRIASVVLGSHPLSLSQVHIQRSTYKYLNLLSFTFESPIHGSTTLLLHSIIARIKPKLFSVRWTTSAQLQGSLFSARFQLEPLKDLQPPDPFPSTAMNFISSKQALILDH